MEVKKIDINKIIEEIKQAGYIPGVRIDYNQLQDLCEKYGRGLEEIDFAVRVLGITQASYHGMKYSAQKTQILSFREKKVTIEEQKQIKNRIIEDGYYPGQAIDYNQLHELYIKYGKKLTESEFAFVILGVNYGNYHTCKQREERVIILKDEEQLSEKDVQKIVKKIKDDGYYEGMLIDYEDLQALYKEYGKGMSEKVFATQVLGIGYGMYGSCKTQGRKARILNNEKTILTYDEIQKIIEQIKSLGYYQNQVLSYDELHNLYVQCGKGFSEKDFAYKVLGVKDGNYRTCKKRGTRVKIFKEENVLAEKERQEIIRKLRDNGYYSGQHIDAKELKQLAKKFGRGLSEKEFSCLVLGIKDSTYDSSFKGNKKTIQILKQEKLITDEEILEIVNQLKSRGYYYGKFINYKEFKEIYMLYGQKSGLGERDFAHIVLRIKTYIYKYIKNNENARTRILKEEKLPEEDIKEIINNVKEDGHSIGQLIDYEEFQKLYEKHSDGLNEKDFAVQILNISEGSYLNLKNGKNKVRILKTKGLVLNYEEKKKIIDEIKENGYIGKSINYKEFQSLYSKYRKIFNERDFALEILGINYHNYTVCRRKGTNIVVKDGLSAQKAKEIKSLYVNQVRYYSKSEIDAICEEYDMTIDDFLTYVYQENFYDSSVFKKVLNENEKLWIGKTRISKEFVNKNIDKISRIASEIATSVCGKYNLKQNKDDYKQNLIIYIIETMGDLEKNLGDSDEFFDMVGKKTRKFCEGDTLEKFRISKRFEGLYKSSSRNIKGKNDEIFEVQYADENIDVEKTVESKMMSEDSSLNESNMDKCISLLKKCIESGMNRSQSIEKTAKLMNLDSEQMLKLMQEYLLKKGKVKNVKGKIILREYR